MKAPANERDMDEKYYFCHSKRKQMHKTMGNITLHDKEFRPYIPAAEIDRVIAEMAERMNRDLQDARPLFVSVLNGSFMFTSDLLKHITIPGTEISFVKMASYEGTTSSGKVSELIGLREDITGRTVVILEDVIDSGQSMAHLLSALQEQAPARIVVATLFHKPDAARCHVPVDYAGITLGNDFIVGRGLDYNGLGRNFPDLYIINQK